MPIETPLKSEHEKLGACFTSESAEYFGCALPANYGDAPREYHFLRDSAGLIDKNYRAYISFTGADRVRYLNALLTSNIRDLAAGHGNLSLLLSPQGRILAEIETLTLPESFLAISCTRIREKLLEAFDHYIIMDDVTMDDLTDRLGTLALEGPLAARIVREFSDIDLNAFEEFAHAETSVANISCRVVRYSSGGNAAADFIVDRQRLAELWDILLASVQHHGGGPVGYEALSVLRLEDGVAWYGIDFDENQIPHQASLESTHINFHKGCYTGQEIVERVRSQGNVQRKRVMLRFSGDAVPQRGEALFSGEDEVGYVTRAAKSPKFGAVIGMGYVRREQFAAGSKVRWKGGEAEVIESPKAAKPADSCG